MQNSGLKVFNYRGLTKEGKESRGEISAENLETAKNLLLNRGLLIKFIYRKSLFFNLKKHFNQDDYIQFITEFIALIKAGLTIPESLEQCAHRPTNPRLTDALKNSLLVVKEGTYLSDAFAQFPDVFDSVITASIKTGEMSGDLVSPLVKYRLYLYRTTIVS